MRSSSVLFLTVCLAACQASKASTGNHMSGAGGSAGSGGTIGVGNGGSGVVVGGMGGGAAALAGSIVSDAGDEVTVSGQPATFDFHVSLDDGSTPTDVVWSVDDTRIGSIGSDGVFHADGYVGGIVTITAGVNGAETTFQFVVNVDISENPGALSSDQQAALVAGGTGDATFKWLYPYDKTVFPRGLGAPELNFGGTAATGLYVQITAPYFKYQQFAGASTLPRTTLPEAVWRGLTLTLGGTDSATVSVSKASSGSVAGPISETWFVAPGTLKGMIYYSTYKSPLAMEASPTDQGAIMRLRPGQTAQVVQGGCTVCHTVSSQGNVLASGIHFDVTGDMNSNPDWNNPQDSSSFDLSTTGTMTTRRQVTDGRQFAFAGLSPDGALALTNGQPKMREPPYVMRGTHSSTGYVSQLVDTTTGTPISAPTLAALVQYVQAPVFSPDGQHVAFINGDRLDPNSQSSANDKRVLSVMDADLTQTPPVFSNLKDIVTETTDALAWPSFLPDGKGVIFHQGDSFDSSKFLTPGGASGAQYAEIHLVDLEGGAVQDLNALNGRDGAGQLYLPYGESTEGKMNYEASVLPVAVGGYYWVLFTSRRAYGNEIAPGGTLTHADDPFGNESDPSPRKKIWIAAIDVDYASKPDASHPAFYLPGQEFESGNMRAYGALAPCQSDGASCESGADCCNGFCRQTSASDTGVPVLQCVPPPENTCSNIDELCNATAKCCDEAALCINGRCSLPPPK